MNDNTKAFLIWFVWGIVAFLIGIAASQISQTNKYKMNLKCIQGELYEEIKPNIFAKSHLECFEQTRL